MSLDIWYHTMLLATWHKRTHPALTPAGEGWYSIYRPPEGWKAGQAGKIRLVPVTCRSVTTADAVVRSVVCEGGGTVCSVGSPGQTDLPVSHTFHYSSTDVYCHFFLICICFFTSFQTTDEEQTSQMLPVVAPDCVCVYYATAWTFNY